MNQKRMKTAHEMWVSGLYFKLFCMCMFVAGLYLSATMWAYALTALLLVLTLANLPGLRAVEAIKSEAKKQSMLIKILALSSVTGAAVLSGLHVLLTAAILVGSFLYLRRVEGFVKMSYEMPRLTPMLQFVTQFIVLAAAVLLTLCAGENRLVGESLMWFIGLTILFLATFAMGWVNFQFIKARAANAGIVERIIVSLKEKDIDISPQNIMQARKATGPLMTTTVQEMATKHDVSVDLMNAAVGTGFSGFLSTLTIPFCFLVSGPIVLNLVAVQFAWWYVAMKTRKPALITEAVRGIRVI